MRRSLLTLNGSLGLTLRRSLLSLNGSLRLTLHRSLLTLNGSLRLTLHRSLLTLNGSLRLTLHRSLLPLNGSLRLTLRRSLLRLNGSLRLTLHRSLGLTLSGSLLSLLRGTVGCPCGRSIVHIFTSLCKAFFGVFPYFSYKYIVAYFSRFFNIREKNILNSFYTISQR